MITLKEAKNYLRVDYEEDDKLIQSLLFTAKNLVMDVGRNRSNPDYKKLTLNLRSILFAQREGVM